MCDTPNVKYLTGNPISDELYKNLKHDKDFYFGMSGVAIDLIPGYGLIFPSNRIHTSGKMETEKTSLMLTSFKYCDEIKIFSNYTIL